MGDITPSSVIEPEARAALVWILGQFGEHIQVSTGALPERFGMYSIISLANVLQCMVAAL